MSLACLPFRDFVYMSKNFLLFLIRQSLQLILFISAAAMEIQRKSLVLQRPVTAESANEDSSDNIITKDQNVDSSSTNGSPISNTATPRDRRSSGSLLDAIPPGAPSSGGRGVVSSTKCELDKCNEWLHMASIFNRIAIEQCVIFTNDLTCLIGIEKQCYLNLYYKGHRGWAEQKYEELNCSQVSTMCTLKPTGFTLSKAFLYGK